MTQLDRLVKLLTLATANPFSLPPMKPEADCRVLTLHQPWASLMSWRVKPYETRSHGTRYRGPVVIHAAVDQGDAIDVELVALEPRLEGTPMPFGACIAIGWLVDCMCVVADGHTPGALGTFGGRRLEAHERVVSPHDDQHHTDRGGRRIADRPDKVQGEAATDRRRVIQLTERDEAFGDTSRGRFLWHWRHVHSFATPIACRGLQGLPRAKPELLEQMCDELMHVQPGQLTWRERFEQVRAGAARTQLMADMRELTDSELCHRYGRVVF